MRRVILTLSGLLLFCTVSLWAFSDDFLRSDAATLGANWTPAEGSDWNIVSNKATAPLFFYEAIVPVGAFPAAQFAQVDTSCVTTGSPLAGVVLRATGNTYYKMYCQNGGAGTGTLALYRRVAGGDAFLTTFQTGLTLDFVYTFKASIAGNVISCFVGGVPCTSAATYDDSAGPPIASGSPGMFAVAANTGTPTFDNFSSTDPTVGTGRRRSFIGGGLF